MKTVKPHISALFISIVLGVFLLISIYTPPDGIHIFDNFVIKLPQITILKNIEQVPVENSLQLHNNDSLLFSVLDTILVHDSQAIALNIEFNPDSLKEKINPIIYANSDSTLLDPFFVKLKAGNARIWHFGDSQIEGDRISSWIRNSLQKKFGGSGVGMIPIKNIFSRHVSVNVEASPNIINYGVRQWKNLDPEERNFGPLLNFSKLTKNDSGYYKGQFSVKTTGTSFVKSRYFNRAVVYYQNSSDSAYIRRVINDSLYTEVQLKNNSGVNRVSFPVKAGTRKIDFEVVGMGEIILYTISLETNYGVLVDNIAVRGSGGLEFYKPESKSMIQISSMLSPDLIIVQYGVNVVPPNYDDYKFYENALYKQLLLLKKISNNAPIIVMGVSDISTHKDNKYSTYSCVPIVIEAQRNAAMRSNSMFWNTFEAMGGENSMPEWVNYKPELATKDYIHFSYKGSTIIAEMFVKSILNEYDKRTGNNK